MGTVADRPADQPKDQSGEVPFWVCPPKVFFIEGGGTRHGWPGPALYSSYEASIYRYVALSKGPYIVFYKGPYVALYSPLEGPIICGLGICSSEPFR